MILYYIVLFDVAEAEAPETSRRRELGLGLPERRLGRRRHVNGVVSKNKRCDNFGFGGIKTALLLRPGLIRPGLCSPKDVSDAGSSVGGQDDSSRGLTPLDLARDRATFRALAQRASARDAEGVLAAIEASGEQVNLERGVLARTALHVALIQAAEQAAQEDAASQYRRAEEIRFGKLAELLRNFPESDLLATDANGWTLLHFACALGRPEELRVVIGHARKLRALGKLGRDRAGRLDAFAGKENASSATGARNARRPGSADPAARKTCAPRFPAARGASQGPGPRKEPAPKAASLAATLNELMGRTPAHLAAQGGGRELRDNPHVRCLALLDRAGLLELEAADDRGLTPVLAACQSGAAAALWWLLERSADCYRVDNEGKNLLHIAASRGHWGLVRQLCEYDADTSRLQEGRDWKGRRPAEVHRTAGAGGRQEGDFVTLWEAARAGDADVLQRLIRFGGPRGEFVDAEAPSPGGWTALMLAAAGGHLPAVRCLLSLRCAYDPPEKLLGPGGSWRSPGGFMRPGARPARGRGPLHLAAEGGHAEVCEVLVRAKAALEARDHEGRTPLLAACAAGRLAALQTLASLGADLQAAAGGEGAFQLMTRTGDTEALAGCCRWLAERFLRQDPCAAVELLTAATAGASRRGRVQATLLHSLKEAKGRAGRAFARPKAKVAFDGGHDSDDDFWFKDGDYL